MRTIKDLRENAVLHWSGELLKYASDSSSLPLLLKTQDNFLSLLKIASKEPLSWQSALEHSVELNGALLLKHLMVLSDIGGEALNKLPPLSKYVPKGEMVFKWNGKEFTYAFKVIHEKTSLNNSALKVDAKGLKLGINLNPKLIDVCMLLLFGSRLENDSLPLEIKERCIIGDFLGQGDALNDFVKQRYLHVSKQVSGATSNSLGQITQTYVCNKLKEYLPDGWHVNLNQTLPGVSHTGNSNETNFDIVVISPNQKYFGIEVSFQVTTNSVIERKARESEAIINSVHQQGHKICYVIDGAGNINVRTNAVSTICSHSDFTVTFADSELLKLANFFIDSAL